MQLINIISKMEISRKTYTCAKGKIEVYRLENSRGAWVELSSLGAGIMSVGVPDREGRIENVALGYANPSDYLYDGPCMGKTAGRYANRIAEGKLRIAGKDYQLATNCGPHHLHGGPEGFQNQLWQSREIESGVEFTLHSPAGDENYPGAMDVKLSYTWDDECRLTLSFEATADAETVVNLTNHTYWNLRGAESGEALLQEVRMKAGRWLPTDPTLVPLGELAGVEGTPMDFREWKPVGKEIAEEFPALKYGKGYDNCWVIDGAEPGRPVENAVELRDKGSGRVLAIDSDQPGVQLYTGNWLKGSPRGRAGREFEDYDGVAIEMQGFPDAPNKPQFPSQILRPGEVYKRKIVYRFMTK